MNTPPTFTLHDGSVLPQTLYGVTNTLKIIPITVTAVKHFEPEGVEPGFTQISTVAANEKDTDEHGLYWKTLYARNNADLGGTVFATCEAAKASAVTFLTGRISQTEHTLAALKQQLEAINAL